MAAAGNDLEAPRADGNLVAMRDAAIGRRQDRNPLQVILAAAEQFVGQVLVHAVTPEEQALGVSAFFGAAVLMIDRLQILDLRHVERTVETLDDPSGETDVIGMRMGHDQPRDFDVGQRALEQRGPGRDRFLVAEAGIYHRPAVAVGGQIDVHGVEAEWQLEPEPQHARHHLDHLIGAGMIFPGVAERLGRGLNGVCFRMHDLVPQYYDIGLAAQSARRQPKNNCDFDKTAASRAQIMRYARRHWPAAHGAAHAARILERNASISERSTSASRRSALEALSTSPAADPASLEAVLTPIMLLETSLVPPAAC